MYKHSEGIAIDVERSYGEIHVLMVNKSREMLQKNNPTSVYGKRILCGVKTINVLGIV